jgi:hypothetical protein
VSRRPALKARIRKARNGSWWKVEILSPRDELVAWAPFDTHAQALAWVCGTAPAGTPLPRLKRLSLRAILTGGHP